MRPAVIKQMLVELTREGCRVETLAHDPPLITFRAPHGTRCTLQPVENDFRLLRFVGADEPSQAARFHSLSEAIRAATAA